MPVDRHRARMRAPRRSDLFAARVRRCGISGFPCALLRVLVVVLALPLMSAGALPFWAQLAGVEGPHVCHCAADKHDCVCPKCYTDREDTPLSSATVKGQCGDDDVAFGGKALCVVLVSPDVPAPPGVTVALFPSPPRLHEGQARPPPTPPPQPTSSRA